MIWKIVGEAKKQVILSAATANYTTINHGNETSSSATNGNITLVTKTKNVTENYTNLSDVYIQTTQTAKYAATVSGKAITFDFLAPSSITANHKSGSLTADNTTTIINGATYDVYNHYGDITYSVDSHSEAAAVEKTVLVEKIIDHPSWGKVVGLAGATLTYEKGIGKNAQGAFHKTLVINFEKGKLIVTTASYGPKANDFTFDDDDFYYYGDKIQENYKINSAAQFDGRWLPALITMDGSGWKYTTYDGRLVQMSEQLAITCDIKNFTGESTAENSPFLNYSGTISNQTLQVMSNMGSAVFTIR